MRKKARTICKYRDRNRKVCNKEVEVGERSIHLVEKHNEMPPEKWLKKQGLPKDIKIIADAMKKDRNLRPPYRWMYRYFDFPYR